MLRHPNIDMIVVVTPDHLHREHTMLALDAGKHVLCEKPLGLTVEDGQQLLDASERHPKLKLMEAFMFRHHPQWQRGKQMVW